MRRSSTLSLLTATITCLAVATMPLGGVASGRTAGPGSGWTPGVSLSRHLDAETVAWGAPASTSVTPSGTALVVWTAHHTVRIAHRPPGGPWRSHRLYRSGVKPPRDPVVAVDADGNQVVAWIQDGGRKGDAVRAMRRPVGEPWGPTVRIADLPQRQSVISQLDVAVARGGIVAISFWRGHITRCPGIGEDCNINHVKGVASTHSPGGWTQRSGFAGPFDHVWGYQNPYTAPGMALVASPSGVVSNTGTVTVGWVKPGYMGTGPVFVRTSAPGSPWAPRHRLTAKHAEASDPLLVATSWGQVTAAWSARRNNRPVVQSRTRLGAGPWGSVQRVMGRGSLNDLGVDGTGSATALVMCRGKDGGAYTIDRPRWGLWGTAHRVGPAGWMGTLSMDSTGEAVAAWQSYKHIFASYHNSAYAWAQATVLTKQAAPTLSAAIGENDTAVVAWYRMAGRHDAKVVLKANVHAG
jgi:hypothetical protein